MLIRETLAWAVLIDAPRMQESSRFSLIRFSTKVVGTIRASNHQSPITNNQCFGLPLILDTKVRDVERALTAAMFIHSILLEACLSYRLFNPALLVAPLTPGYYLPPLRGYWNLSPIIHFETTAPEPFVTKQSYGNADSHFRLHPGDSLDGASPTT